MKLAQALNLAAAAMFLIGLVFVSTPFAVGGAAMAVLSAFLKGTIDE